MGLSGPRLSWQEQTRYRYLLSMDGNGASCSRVALALALASQGVLAKYNLAHLLYYLRGLEPWLHYVPITCDGDVPELVAAAGRTIDRDRAIAERSRQFARSHLTRAAALRHTAELLRGYRLLLR